MQIKKVLAVVMSLCMIAGAESYCAPVISNSITAQASTVESDCFSFDEETGVLTLRGDVEASALWLFSNKQNVKSIIAEDGTVFPKTCNCLFQGFKNCTDIDLKHVDTSDAKSMYNMFEGCSSLTSLELSGFNTSNVTNMSQMFKNCSGLTTLDLSGFNTSNVDTMSDMFRNCSRLTTLDLTRFDTGHVKSMSCMFCGCSSLKELDLSRFNTKRVSSTDHMFCGCSSLAKLNIGNFDVRKVTNMWGMFYGCSGLKTLDLSSFQTNSVTDLGSMFCDCSSLKELDLSGFISKQVTSIDGMFRGCSSLKGLDLSGINTIRVRDTNSMNEVFSGCTNLTYLNISNFDTSNNPCLTDIFRDCNSLNTLVLGEKYTEIITAQALPNGDGWKKMPDSETIVSGDGEFAVIKNDGKNTYTRFTAITTTYPTNIKVEYSEKNHQVRFTWDEVKGAERYGIAVYQTGKWRLQTQSITDTVYTTPKNLTPGKTYKVAIAAKVNGKWDTANAIKHAVSITIK
ncbi:BspA family leucine-rich repeat surface protein [Ruminococcus albus]|uniref:BspA family leucine-rich repeat surface protein n=1 Tax=Ruminococcus albus TaxID=1264 RepID=UPI000466EB51|nr:BspA family leucine-rich repeat surface protein [Ruminococcus albus]